MRRKLKNLKNKQGYSENGAPRSKIDEAQYREHGAAVAMNQRDTSVHSGWGWATRPRDSAISIRKHHITGISGASGPT